MLCNGLTNRHRVIIFIDVMFIKIWIFLTYLEEFYIFRLLKILGACCKIICTVLQAIPIPLEALRIVGV